MLGSVIDAGRYVLSTDDEAEDGDLLKSQASIYLFRYFLSTYPWRLIKMNNSQSVAILS